VVREWCFGAINADPVGSVRGSLRGYRSNDDDDDESVDDGNRDDGDDDDDDDAAG